MTDIRKKVEPLNRLMESRYGLSIETVEEKYLNDLVRLYDEKREIIIARLGEAAALADSEYQKAVLISETARMMLREIAPKRIKRKRAR